MKKAVTKQVKREVTAEVKNTTERILRKGGQEGIRETLLFLLTKRFGRLPAKSSASPSSTPAAWTSSSANPARA